MLRFLSLPTPTVRRYSLTSCRAFAWLLFSGVAHSIETHESWLRIYRVMEYRVMEYWAEVGMTGWKINRVATE